MSATGALWLVGCGNMGGAMLRGWLGSGIEPARITVIDPYLAVAPAGVRLLTGVPQGEAAPATLLLAVKPQMLSAIAESLAPALGEGTLLLSILAGVEVDTLRARLPAPRAIIRVMPNMPAAIGRGMTVLYADGCDAAQKQAADALMQPLGTNEWVDDERQFHAVTALSGSGPAFVFRFIDALAQAGAALGLPADQAARLALGTVLGSASLAEVSEESPAMLAERVASPGGTTRAGLDVLDAGGAMAALVSATLEAAAKRSAELAEAAR
jgi:pyrroline-5-carboxylate reductase